MAIAVLGTGCGRAEVYRDSVNPAEAQASSTPILQFSVSPEPTRFDWYVDAAVEADYALQVCDQTECKPYLFAMCAGQTQCRVLDLDQKEVGSAEVSLEQELRHIWFEDPQGGGTLPEGSYFEVTILRQLFSAQADLSNQQ